MPFWYNYRNCLIILISKLSTLKVDIFLQWKRIKLDHLLAVYKNLIQAFNIDHAHCLYQTTEAIDCIY